MSTSARGGARRFSSQERWTLAAGMVAASLVPLNSTMIAVGLPEIAHDLDVPRGTATLLVISYLVAMALLQPVMGRVGDRIGSRRALHAGLVGFSAASVLAAAAPTFGALLVARCLQAAFAACLIPNVQAIMRTAMSEVHRGRAFGLLGSGIGAGAAAGPVVGGLLVELTGWRGIFIVNTPLAISAVIMFVRFAPPGDEVDVRSSARGDLWRPRFIAACVTQAASNAALYSVLLVVPLILDHRDWSSASRGLVLSGLTLGMLVLSPYGGTLSDRRGRAYPVVVGMVIGVAGTSILAIGMSTPALVVVGVIVTGVAMGLSSASLQTGALEAVDPSIAARAAGVLSTSRYIGSIGGSLAIAGLVGDGVDGVRIILVLTVVASVIATLAATELARPSDTDHDVADDAVIPTTDAVG